MAPKIELETLNGGNNGVDVFRFLNYAESQREDRIFRVNTNEPMVAAFISINDVVGKFRQNCLPPFSF